MLEAQLSYQKSLAIFDKKTLKSKEKVLPLIKKHLDAIKTLITKTEKNGDFCVCYEFESADELDSFERKQERQQIKKDLEKKGYIVNLKKIYNLKKKNYFNWVYISWDSPRINPRRHD